MAFCKNSYLDAQIYESWKDEEPWERGQTSPFCRNNSTFSLQLPAASSWTTCLHCNNYMQRIPGELASAFILLLRLLAWDQIWNLVNVISGLVTLAWNYSTTSGHRDISIFYLFFYKLFLSAWRVSFRDSRGAEELRVLSGKPLRSTALVPGISQCLFYRASVFNLLPFFSLFILLPALCNQS